MLPLVLGIIGSLLGQASSQIVGGVDITNLPICAQGCLAGNTDAASGCAVTDVHCLCTSVPYINALSCCLQKSCESADQKVALSFNIALCEQFNVTIPDFLGCSPLSTASSKTGIRSVTNNPATLITSSITASTISSLQSAFSYAPAGPLADFTPRSLLSGTCSTPAIASTTLDGGALQLFPWIGCAKENPDCCPFDPISPGPISVCPLDFVTTSKACCPNGWSVYSSAIAGETPCVTTPSLPLVASKTPTASDGPAASVLSSELFTVRYVLKDPTPKGMPAGTIAGIAVGTAGGMALAALGLFYLFRYRRRKAESTRYNATVPRSMTDTTSQFSPISPLGKHTPSTKTYRSHAISPPATDMEIPSELASPPPPTELDVAASPASPPVEMQGSTFINEHHPAFGPSASVAEATPSAAGTPNTMARTDSNMEIHRPPFGTLERVPTTNINI